LLKCKSVIVVSAQTRFFASRAVRIHDHERAAVATSDERLTVGRDGDGEPAERHAGKGGRYEDGCDEVRHEAAMRFFHVF
jgi:hypothetical protein